MSPALLLLVCSVAIQPAEGTSGNRAFRCPQVRPGDQDPQGLADRRARGRRPDLRGDHSAG